MRSNNPPNSGGCASRVISSGAASGERPARGRVWERVYAPGENGDTPELWLFREGGLL